MPSEPKLTAELVPSTCWWSNVRTQVTPDQWGVCKRYAGERASWRCEVCGGRGPKWPVECHEIWFYDETGAAPVQRLVGLTALCPPCHEVKHIGRAEVTGNGARARRRLQVGNGWTAAETERYLEGVWSEWERRSELDWQLDVSWLAQLLGADFELATAVR